MNFSFSFKHMEVSPYLLKYSKKKLNEKISKFIPGFFETNISFYTAGKRFGCHVNLCGGGLDYFVSAEAKDMYSAVNSVAIKLERQLRKTKEKRNITRIRHHELEKTNSSVINPYLDNFDLTSQAQAVNQN